MFILFCGWRGARPVDLSRGPRMLPWRFMAALGLVAVIFLLVHLLALVRPAGAV